MSEEYREEVQRVLITCMISDPDSFVRCQNIVQEEYFEDRLRPAVRFIKDYVGEHQVLPLPIQIEAITGQKFELLAEAPKHSEWFLDTIEKFCRHRALENCIFDGPDLLAQGAGGELERRVRDALTISLMSDLGVSYFHDVKGRIERMRDRSKLISTGWADIDHNLYGGLTPGSLSLFAGGSGSGKSLFLQNIALNWVFMGMNVLYISLELSEDLVSQRLDAMVSGQSTVDVFSNPDATAARVGEAARRSSVPVGDLRVKKLPEAGTSANTIRAYIKEYMVQTGLKPDALIVDYLDLMHPNNSKIDVSNIFTKDKYVSEELRSIGSEYGIPVVSASQLNRQSIEAEEFDHSHIAGGLSKINTADNVFGIFTTKVMKERGVYDIQYLKTRSANAVGRKTSLAYNNSTMRISNAGAQQVKISDEQARQTTADIDKQGKSLLAQVAEMHDRGVIPAPFNPIAGEVIPAGLGGDYKGEVTLSIVERASLRLKEKEAQKPK